ncbi:hypothetical protein CapIbe_005942 [Capra ibex]
MGAVSVRTGLSFGLLHADGLHVSEFRVWVSHHCWTNGGAVSGTAGHPPEPERALSAPVLEFCQGNVVKGQPEGQIACVRGAHTPAAVL